jgi:SPP1 family predicted phage head-tail adaptor
MTEFLPSDLRDRVTLEELARASDEGGGFVETWEKVAELAADIRPADGSETVEADRLAASLTHQIALRYRPSVQPAMRFRKTGRVFHILSVIDVDERRRWLKFLCEEREL